MKIFEKELETFDALLPHLLVKNEGEFIVIQGTVVAGILPLWEDALKLGYDTFELTGFMVKEILKTERVETLSQIKNLTHAI